MAQKYFWLLIILVLGLMACSGEDETTAQVSGAARSNSSTSNEQNGNSDDETADEDGNTTESSDSLTLANLPMPRPDAFVLPDLDIPYPIAFSHDETLYVARFDGEQATWLTDTLVFNIKVKSGSQLVYTAMGSESPTSVFSRYSSIYIYDTDTNDFLNEILLPDDDHFAQVDNWSADGQWLIVTRFEDDGPITDIIATDGTEPMQSLTSIAASVWLDDNTILLFEVDDNNEITSVVRYDPATDSNLDVELDASLLAGDNTFVQNYILLSEQLAAQNLSLGTVQEDNLQAIVDPTDESFVVIVQPENPSNAAICEAWAIEGGELGGEVSTLYRTHETHALTDLHRLPDGSIIFLRWFKSDCDFSEALQAEVLRVSPDGTSEVIARDLYVNFQSVVGRNFFRTTQARMDVSADGQYMVWISQEELTRGDVALNLTDLTTGESAVLMVTPEADGILFRTVVWID